MKDNKYILTQDIIIPKGTIFDRAANERGGEKVVECVVGISKDYATYISIKKSDIRDTNGVIEKCIIGLNNP